jgi:hypothetical protein
MKTQRSRGEGWIFARSTDFSRPRFVGVVLLAVLSVVDLLFFG